MSRGVLQSSSRPLQPRSGHAEHTWTEAAATLQKEWGGHLDIAGARGQCTTCGPAARPSDLRTPTTAGKAPRNQPRLLGAPGVEARRYGTALVQQRNESRDLAQFWAGRVTPGQRTGAPRRLPSTKLFKFEVCAWTDTSPRIDPGSADYNDGSDSPELTKWQLHEQSLRPRQDCEIDSKSVPECNSTTRPIPGPA